MSDSTREFASAAHGTDNLLAHAVSSSARGEKIERKFTLAAANCRMSELIFIGRENLDALSTSRNRDIPLLRVRRSADGGIGKQHMIDSFPLASVRWGCVPAEKVSIVRRKDATIRQPNRSARFNLRDADDFAVREFA